MLSNCCSKFLLPFRFNSEQENESHDEHDYDVETESESNMETVAAKRQAVEEPKQDDNIAASSDSPRNSFIRVRPIEELLAPSSSQNIDTTSKANDVSSCISGDSRPKILTVKFPARAKKSSKKRKRAKRIVLRSGSFKWCCNNCPASFNTEPLVKAHLLLVHHYATDRLIRQFDCTMCQYSDDLETTIRSHLNTEHGESDWSKVKCNYKTIATFE